MGRKGLIAVIVVALGLQVAAQPAWAQDKGDKADKTEKTDKVDKAEKPKNSSLTIPKEEKDLVDWILAPADDAYAFLSRAKASCDWAGYTVARTRLLAAIQGMKQRAKTAKGAGKLAS